MARHEKGGKKRRAPLANGSVDAKGKTKGGGKDVGKRRKTGPRLPSALRKELDLLNPKPHDSGEEIDSEEEERNRDVYEYEEGVAEEETSKNRRFDAVDNLEYELPEEFQDEDVSSDESGDDEGDGDKHGRMLQGITGIPGRAFDGIKTKAPFLVDAVETAGGNPQITIHDLLDPLHGKSGYSELRKAVQQLERKPMKVHAPLPKAERERMERKVAYEHSRKDITKWEPLVKRNREAPTIYFEKDMDLGFNTVGAIASTFEPRTEFEKKMASLFSDPELVEAHQKDGLRLLELNKISIEDVKERQNRLAKMRSLLFRHDMKQKRIKNIKSKTYHRMLKKDRSKATTNDMLMDPEAIQEDARKQEYKRAEERLTLKHKNKSKWAKRILERGLKTQDEGTRAALAEQLHQHKLLTRKMNSMKDSSSEDSSDDDDNDEEDLSPSDCASKLIMKAKEKIAKVIEEEDDIPKSGVLSLPFMVRGLQKKNKAADDEARLALKEYDVSLGKLDDGNGAGNPALGASSGRKIFGAHKNQAQEPTKQNKPENITYSSDSEADFEMSEKKKGYDKENELTETLIDPRSLLVEKSEKSEEFAFVGFDDTASEPSTKTTYEVSIFASGSWRKMGGEKSVDGTGKTCNAVTSSTLPVYDAKEPDLDSDVAESDHEMVDGFISSGGKSEYELPSQSDLIHRAFAGDDVELEFEKDKMETLNEEIPEPEKPLSLPGWGQWTHVQQKKGLPSWMVKEHEDAKKEREKALKRRKDAHLKNVIISEKTDKKAEKLHTKTLPFPFTSKEVFEQSIRMPIGPDFNPAISVGALTRPAVVKEPGTIIEPIKYEEVDPYEKPDETNTKPHKGKDKKSRRGNGKVTAKRKGG